MDKKKLQLGETIRIYNSNELSENFHESQLEDFNESQDEILVTCPIVQTEYVMISIGRKVRIEYLRGDSGIYMFDAVVSDHVMENNVKCLKIKRLGEIKKIQIRKHYRLRDEWELIRYDEHTGEEETVLTINISGGGLKFYTNQFYNIEDNVNFSMNEEKFAIKLKGRVVRCVENKTEKHSEYEYVVCAEFVDLGRYEKEHLIQHIFERQRILRKKRVKNERGEDYSDYAYRFGVRNKGRQFKYAKLGTKARRIP